MSYIDQVYSFDDRKAILEYLGKAIRYEGLSTKSDLCCDDLIDNICIILRDGEKFAFLHRSFQEYFSALFLSTRDFDAFFPCVDQIAKRDYDTMSVLVFLAEMNRDLFERRYAGPKIRELAKETRTNNYKKFLGLFFTSLTYRADRKRFVTSILMTGGPPYFYLFNKLRIIYNAVQFPNPELEEVRESLEISGDKDVEYDIVDMLSITPWGLKSI